MTMTADAVTRLSRRQLAWWAAQAIPDGSCVNLGIGLPTLCANVMPADREIVLHSENGVLGFGPAPAPGEEDRDLINASKEFITMRPGGAFFVHTDAFVMIRGGHLDLALLGAFEVSGSGDLANWTTGDRRFPPGVGGAMDLAVGAKAVWVLTEHVTKKGELKIVERCRYPLTAPRAVRKVFTDLAEIDVTTDGLLVRAMVEGLTLDGLQSLTGPKLRLAADCRVMTAPD
ncbi:MAG TPA: 3-oxoacid CoA-transferase subunit B [Thalassobaculum sp.]